MRLDMIRKTSLLRKINPIARRSSFARKIIYNSNILRCASAEMTWRLRLRARELLRRSQTRINLLFTMSEIPHARLRRQRGRSDVSRTTIGSKCLGNQTIWWSQTGSNRRPHACKARALPAELWPRTRRRILTSVMRRLSFERKRTRSKWWAWEDLNFRPHAYQARALTN